MHVRGYALAELPHQQGCFSRAVIRFSSGQTVV
uniref:Uncharacterized protein n=1 Tax=Anopheles dirus TaxID=7168 RepID=A0A182NWD2_9DIPT